MRTIAAVNLRPDQEYGTTIAMKRHFRFKAAKQYEIAYGVSFFMHGAEHAGALPEQEAKARERELRIEDLDCYRRPGITGTFCIRIGPGALPDDEAGRMLGDLDRALKGALSPPDMWFDDAPNRAAREAVEMMCWLDHKAAITGLERAAGKVCGADGNIIRALARFAHTGEGRAAFLRAIDAIRPGYLPDAFAAHEEHIGPVPRALLKRFLCSQDGTARWQTVRFLCEPKHLPVIESLLADQDLGQEERQELRENIEYIRHPEGVPLKKGAGHQKAALPETHPGGKSGEESWLRRNWGYLLGAIGALAGSCLLLVLRRTRGLRNQKLRGHGNRGQSC